MAYTAEQGSGWRVVREFIDPDNAELAGQQALALISEQSNYLTHDPYEVPGMANLKFYTFKAWHPGTYPEYPGSIQADGVELVKAQHLVDAHRKAAKVVRGTIPGCQLSVYEPGGHTRNHRDRFQDETFALGLLSVGHWVIKDPVTKAKHEFDVYPGDGVHIVNPRLQRLRPLHKVINNTSVQRIALVE